MFDVENIIVWENISADSCAPVCTLDEGNRIANNEIDKQGLISIDISLEETDIFQQLQIHNIVKIEWSKKTRLITTITKKTEIDKFIKDNNLEAERLLFHKIIANINAQVSFYIDVANFGEIVNDLKRLDNDNLKFTELLSKYEKRYVPVGESKKGDELVSISFAFNNPSDRITIHNSVVIGYIMDCLRKNYKTVNIPKFNISSRFLEFKRHTTIILFHFFSNENSTYYIKSKMSLFSKLSELFEISGIHDITKSAIKKWIQIATKGI